MRGLARLLAREARRLRLALLVLGIGGAVWAVVLRFTTGLRAPLCDRLPMTAGLMCAVAALVLPVVSLGADRRLARLAARRGGRLPRWPLLASKWLVCVGAWAAVAVWASAVALLCSPSAECLREWAVVLDAGWLWVLLLFAGSFFASAATGRVGTALGLGALLGILPLFFMRYPFELPVGAEGEHATKAIVGGMATLWLFGMALLAFPARLAAPATRWAKARVQARAGCCVAAAGLAMALVAPMIVVVACLLLRPQDATRLTGPQLSPDGRFIAFTASFHGWPSKKEMVRAYVLETETGRVHRLTCLQRSFLPTRAVWSPGGRHLAYWITPGPLGQAWQRLRRRDPEFGVQEYAGVLGILDTRTGEHQAVRHRALPAYWMRWTEEGAITVWSQASPPQTAEERRVYVEDRYDVASRAWAEAARGLSRKEMQDRAWTGNGWRQEEVTGGSEDERTWRLGDPKGRGISLVLRPPDPPAPGSKHWVMELSVGRGGPTRLGGLEDPWTVKGCCAFSPGGRWLVYAASQGSGPLASWLLEIGSGERRKLAGPGAALDWHPHFTPDDTRLVWLPGSAVVRETGGRAAGPCFYVQGLPAGLPRRVGLPGRSAVAPENLHYAGPDNASLYFIREARLWRVPLDGAAPQPLFPR